MSGMALRTVSPSRVRIRRKVVCVAGCWGPKLSVQRYSFSVVVARAAASRDSSMASASFRGMTTLRAARGLADAARPQAAYSALRPRDDREIMAFPASVQGVILAHRE